MANEAAMAMKQMDALALGQYIAEFIDGNKHSRSVERRWLAEYLTHHLAVVRKVHSGEQDVGITEQVKLFRVGEIDAERKRLTAEVDTLEREKSQLMRAVR